MPQPPSLRRPATLCDPVASPTALPATGSTRHVSQLLGSPPRHTSPRSRQIPDPSRPQRGITPRRFHCVRATRLFAACGGALRQPDATSRTLTATTDLPTHSPRLHTWSPFIFPIPGLSPFCPFLCFPLKRFPAHIFPTKTQPCSRFRPKHNVTTPAMASFGMGTTHVGSIRRDGAGFCRPGE
jgi:hypothetical protein